MSANENLDHDPWRKRLSQELVKIIHATPGLEGHPITYLDVARQLARPPETKFGDFAFPCFQFAKVARQSPQLIAKAFCEKLNAAKIPGLAKCEVAQAFVNVFIDKVAMSRELFPQIASGSYFEVLQKSRASLAKKVMIEFSQPNTHKEFHVGHMRNVALGDAIVRAYRYSGHDVVAANYPGDEGTHVAKCIWYMQKNKLKAPGKDRGEWLGEVYTQSVRFLAEQKDEALKTCNQEVAEVLRGIEEKSGSTYQLWKETRQWSLDLFTQIYEWLGVKFDIYFFESELSEESQDIVDQYLKKGVFVESDGAMGVDLNDYKLGFLILRKRDGNTLYATKDLALARRKFEKFGIQKSIYVVANEQNLHFRQVFKTLELMGFAQAKDCFHLNYGLVLLPEGKMSSRQGTSVSLKVLRGEIDAELEKIMEKYRAEWSEEEIGDVKNKLNVGAVKYGMLSTDPVKDVVFDIKHWLSFEGDSGPYLMYTYARASSILRKGAEAGFSDKDDGGYAYTEEVEFDLIRQLYDFNDIILQVSEQNKPSLLAHYLFDLSQVFNRFYNNASVLKAEDPKVAASRLLLVRSFSLLLQKGLYLLGIVAPERM